MPLDATVVYRPAWYAKQTWRNPEVVRFMKRHPTHCHACGVPLTQTVVYYDSHKRRHGFCSRIHMEVWHLLKRLEAARG